MRGALIRRNGGGIAKARAITIPAPHAGINGVDALAGGMGAADAIDIDNFNCVGGALETRAGYRVRHDLGTGAAVKLLLPLPDPAAGSLVASGGRLFIATATTVTQLSSGHASDRWSAAIMNGRILLVNGQDGPRTVFQGAVSATPWTGPADTARLCRVRAHAKRLFFAERGSARFWYCEAAGNIQGALKSFDLSGVGNRGGVLEEIATMAPDGGVGGDDDAIVFFMSSGEAIVYRGSNPDDAANWGRVGVFPVARPLAVESHAGDVLTVSADGYAELSRVLPAGRSPVAGFGARLGRHASQAVAAFAANPGWQILHSPVVPAILVHVPHTATGGRQHVYNPATGAWTRWSGLPATVWGHLCEGLHFGTADGRVCAMGGEDDDGAAIVATAYGAWSVLGAAGRRKRIGLVKPIVSATSTPTVRHVLGIDFRAPQPGAAGRAQAAADAGIWDASRWDAAVWAGAERVTADFRGGGAIGEWVSVGIRVDTMAGPARWLATTLMVETGV